MSKVCAVWMLGCLQLQWYHRSPEFKSKCHKIIHHCSHVDSQMYLTWPAGLEGKCGSFWDALPMAAEACTLLAEALGSSQTFLWSEERSWLQLQRCGWLTCTTPKSIQHESHVKKASVSQATEFPSRLDSQPRQNMPLHRHLWNSG